MDAHGQKKSLKLALICMDSNFIKELFSYKCTIPTIVKG